MNAGILKQFFLGQADGPTLARDLIGALELDASGNHRLAMKDLAEDFEVLSSHLIRLCDAVLTREILAADLEAVGFGILASDHFTFPESPDGELVVKVLNCWATPEANYRLDDGTIAKFRHLLATGENTLTHADHWGAGQAR